MLCLLLCAAAPCAWAKDSITWGITDWPPVYILPGDAVPQDLMHQGWPDHTIDALTQALPEFEHRRVLMNADRLTSMMDAGEHVCYATIILTPMRDKTRYFTYANFSEPRSLIVPAALVPKLTLKDGAVVLSALLQDSRFKGLLVSQRSYGMALDAVLHDARAGAITRVNSPDMGRNLLHMLLAGRMDYTIEYPSSLDYRRRLDPRFNALDALPIAEDTNLTWDGVACPHNEWGKAVIEKIDAALPALVADPAYRAARMRWLSPALRDRLARQIDEFYRFRSKPGRTNIKP